MYARNARFVSESTRGPRRARTAAARQHGNLGCGLHAPSICCDQVDAAAAIWIRS